MGAKRKERDKMRKTDSDKKWWKFMRKTKVKPTKQLNIQHNVNFKQSYEGETEYYEMNNFLDRDNNHYRSVNATGNFSFCQKSITRGRNHRLTSSKPRLLKIS